MKLLQLLAASLLPLVALSAKTKGKDSYTTYFEKMQKTPSLKLDDSSFSKLTALPRNHTSAIFFTALEPRVGCQLCKEMQPEWDVLASSWLKGDPQGESKMLFGTLDFKDARQTFQSFQLQTAPILFVFHPTVGPNAKGDGSPDRQDFGNGPQTAEMMRQWLVRQLPGRPHPQIYRPIDWFRVGMLGGAGLTLLTILVVAWPYLQPLLYSRSVWAAISLMAILLFTSGHMFNQIRGVPYVMQDQKGQLQFVTGGFQNQLGLESQIVAALYAILSFATITLATKVPRIADPRRQQVAVLVWGGVMFGVYSLLLSFFRMKNGGYPFWLPPF